jgi:hypothetical protein
LVCAAEGSMACFDTLAYGAHVSDVSVCVCARVRVAGHRCDGVQR